MVGFEGGVKYWNKMHNDTVELLGWSTEKNDGVFVGTFTDPDKGKQATLSLIEEGADVILPVAGLTGNGTFIAAKEKGVLAIGVDTDQCVSVPDACDVILTSILKNMDVAVFAAIKALKDGTFKGGVYSGGLANDGVGIAPFGKNADKISTDVQKELDQVKADLIAGKISVKETALSKSAVEQLAQTYRDNGVPRFALITNISLQGNAYAVDYFVEGYEQKLPGQHVHFFFDTVSQSEAGMPGSGPWILYAGPSPFMDYKPSDRPRNATKMCILVAKQNHAIEPDTGNCMTLPDVTVTPSP
jgi:hypothetical protein